MNARWKKKDIHTTMRDNARGQGERFATSHLIRARNSRALLFTVGDFVDLGWKSENFSQNRRDYGFPAVCLIELARAYQCTSLDVVGKREI